MGRLLYNVFVTCTMDTPHLICVTYYPLLFMNVTNYPVRNRNDYTVPRCRLSLYPSSFIPSVINLWNSLDDTRNTRTFDTFNIKRKVVLDKIPAHFLVGDRRPNVLYARLRRNCSSLTKWPISIQYNNRFEMCLRIYQGGRFPLSLELPLIYRTQENSL